MKVKTIKGILATVCQDPRDPNYSLRLRGDPQHYTVAGRTYLPSPTGTVPQAGDILNVIATFKHLRGDLLVELDVDLERPDYALECRLSESPTLTIGGGQS